eukprot:Colp12_sorted_trinity150504_noHs@17375
MLRSVQLSSDVLLVCLAHALSTDKEEIMGLLIGDVTEDNVGNIWSMCLLTRSDRRKDRVEISSEQLAEAAMLAERLTQKVGKTMRVIGWYHSHPHITVWPSHVDVRTQADYQMLDPNFVGLIFSCFEQGGNQTEGRMQVTCFQSKPGDDGAGLTRVEIPLEIVNNFLDDVTLDNLLQLPTILLKEEKDHYEEMLKPVIEAKNILAAISHGAVYTKSLCRLIDRVLTPLLVSLEDRLIQNKRKYQELL